VGATENGIIEQLNKAFDPEDRPFTIEDGKVTFDTPDGDTAWLFEYDGQVYASLFSYRDNSETWWADEREVGPYGDAVEAVKHLAGWND